jgi:hypothetical protein
MVRIGGGVMAASTKGEDTLKSNNNTSVKNPWNK